MATTQQNTSKPAPKKGAPEDQVEEAPKPKKSKKKLVFLFIVFLLLCAGSGGAWWYFTGDEDGKKENAKNEKPVAPVFLHLEQFTVNLVPESGEHYLQVAITLQVETKEDVEQLKLYMPQIRSRVLLLLTSKKASEIANIQGKKKLCEEIMAQVNMPLTAQGKQQKVLNVFFTSFVIQ